MRIRNFLAAAFAALVAAAVSLMAAPGAGAYAPAVPQPFGTPQPLVAPTGEVAEWTVHDLRLSHDVIPFPVQGDLWEANATVHAAHGGVTPVVSDFNARAANGDTYRVMFNVATAEGINPETIAQGDSTVGKLYFDVIGPAPDSVVYNDGHADALVWVQ